MYNSVAQHIRTIANEVAVNKKFYPYLSYVKKVSNHIDKYNKNEREYIDYKTALDELTKCKKHLSVNISDTNRKPLYDFVTSDIENSMKSILQERKEIYSSLLEDMAYLRNDIDVENKINRGEKLINELYLNYEPYKDFSFLRDKYVIRCHTAISNVISKYPTIRLEPNTQLPQKFYNLDEIKYCGFNDDMLNWLIYEFKNMYANGWCSYVTNVFIKYGIGQKALSSRYN